MSEKKHLLLVIVSVLCVSSMAFGWAGNTHATLCQITFDDAVVSPLLGGISQSTIENYTGEPPSTWHTQQWNDIDDRAYVEGAGAPNGNNYWGLSETTRLQYLQHNTTDVGVPLGHAPANTVYTNTTAEAILEAQVATWSTYPDVEGTCNYTHNRNGHSFSYTGTIDQVVATHYDACRDNASWFKSTKNWLGLHSTTDNRDAGWNGTTIGLMLQRAVMVDYFLSKESLVVAAPKFPAAWSGQNITLSQDGAYDPDCVSWNSNGTYSQIYGIHSQGIQYCLWDVNGDVPYGGNWDYGTYSMDITLPVDTLLAMGVPANQWSLFYTYMIDNEGKDWAATDAMYLAVGGGVPEPATMSLLALGGLALLRRKK